MHLPSFRSQAADHKFCCGSLLFCCQSFSDVSPYMCTCVHIILVRFQLLSGHLLGLSAHFVDHMFSLYFDCLLYIVISRFGFKGWSWVLIASVPDHCILFTCNSFETFIVFTFSFRKG